MAITTVCIATIQAGEQYIRFFWGEDRMKLVSDTIGRKDNATEKDIKNAILTVKKHFAICGKRRKSVMVR